MKKLVCVYLLFFSITTFAFGQGLPMAVPEEVDVSAERLERIRPVMQDYVDKEKLPGFLTVVARHGKIVHFETVGMRDIENKKPIEPDTIFRIYSMSKPITSVAIMMLYEESHFQLDTPAAKFIPEFENMKVYNEDQTEILDAKKKITIKHLLMHTAGFTYGWGDKPVDERYKELKIFENVIDLTSSAKLANMVEKLANIPLVHEPGKKWTYGVSTDVLGYLVQAISGMPFEKFLQTRLFEPLGMMDTAFSVPPEKRDRFAALYSFTKKEGIERVGKKATANGEFTFFPSGGGGLVSTAADYMRFCQMLLNGGELDGVRILGKETVELMRYPHHDGWFGLGFAVVNDKESKDSDDNDDKKDPGDKDDDGDEESKDTPESVGSFSWSGAAATIFWIDPVEELIGVLMTQIHNNPYPFHDQFKALTYQALTE
ncbi:MAG: serine hydrolase [Candidatus Poribacteria bacterium]|nr:serine hydrolase [Candidatus Poribacteria bacterium]